MNGRAWKGWEKHWFGVDGPEKFGLEEVHGHGWLRSHWFLICVFYTLLAALPHSYTTSFGTSSANFSSRLLFLDAQFTAYHYSWLPSWT